MKKNQRICPKCGSTHTEWEGDDKLGFLICLECGYDGDEYEASDDGRTGNSGGGSPYKRGGALRTQKR